MLLDFHLSLQGLCQSANLYYFYDLKVPLDKSWGAKSLPKNVKSKQPIPVVSFCYLLQKA